VIIPSTAFVLGAGLGTRLRPLTAQQPKPLLPLQGRPLLFHILDQLIEIGISRVIINTHHAAERYAAAFPDSRYRDLPLVFRHEPVLLETGGGLKNIEDLLPPDEPLLVYNGDVFSTLPLAPLLAHHDDHRNLVTLALRSHGEPQNVRLASDGRVTDLRSRLQGEGLACLFTGLYVVEPAFLHYLKAGEIESVVEGFLRAIQAGEPIGGVLLDAGTWSDIGTISEYERLQHIVSSL
jgi:NDP-sugar pyrophosphorylase family protein